MTYDEFLAMLPLLVPFIPVFLALLKFFSRKRTYTLLEILEKLDVKVSFKTKIFSVDVKSRVDPKTLSEEQLVETSEHDANSRAAPALGTETIETT